MFPSEPSLADPADPLATNQSICNYLYTETDPNTGETHYFNLIVTTQYAKFKQANHTILYYYPIEKSATLQELLTIFKENPELPTISETINEGMDTEKTSYYRRMHKKIDLSRYPIGINLTHPEWYFDDKPSKKTMINFLGQIEKDIAQENRDYHPQNNPVFKSTLFSEGTLINNAENTSHYTLIGADLLPAVSNQNRIRFCVGEINPPQHYNQRNNIELIQGHWNLLRDSEGRKDLKWHDVKYSKNHQEKLGKLTLFENEFFHELKCRTLRNMNIGETLTADEQAYIDYHMQNTTSSHLERIKDQLFCEFKMTRYIHPGTKPLLDLGSAYLMLMHKLGESLTQHFTFHPKPLLLRKRLEFIRPLLHLLNNFHKKGLLHGDIKSDNITISDNQFHFIDFGTTTTIAEQAEKPDYRHATPSYAYRGIKPLTPEQQERWAMMLVIYEILKLQSPAINQILHGNPFLRQWQAIYTHEAEDGLLDDTHL